MSREEFTMIARLILSAWFAALLTTTVQGKETPRGEPVAGEGSTGPNVVNIRAVGLTFEGPSEIPSGWTTLRLENASGMIHFAIVDVPPEGITAQIFNDTVAVYFQDAMDAMNAGDDEGVATAYAKFPDWIADLGRNGGPGLLSPGLTGQSTVYLEPGVYILECYVKSGGVFHTTSPGDGQLGMMLELTVTDEKTGASEPVANATVAIRNNGMEIVGGELKRGRNTIRVEFVEQQALPSFVGNDIHLFRVEGEGSIARADAWMDWRTKQGLQDPSPVIFLGGLNDMPQGTHGFFTVDLEAGDYAFISEVPAPREMGLFLPFTID
jgi:hypothetical protein